MGSTPQACFDSAYENIDSLVGLADFLDIDVCGAVRSVAFNSAVGIDVFRTGLVVGGIV